MAARFTDSGFLSSAASSLFRRGSGATTSERSRSGSVNNAPGLTTNSLMTRQSTVGGLQIFDHPVDQEAIDRFEDVVERLTTPLIKYLRKGRTDFRPTALKLMVLGRDEQTAKPWIVLLCPKGVEKRIKKFLQQGMVRRLCETQEPGQVSFEIAVVGQPPVPTERKTPIQVFSETRPDDAEQWWVPHIKVTHSNNDHTAILGGYVLATSKLGKTTAYGLTCGHVLPQSQVEVDESSTLSDSTDDTSSRLDLDNCWPAGENIADNSNDDVDTIRDSGEFSRPNLDTANSPYGGPWPTYEFDGRIVGRENAVEENLEEKSTTAIFDNMVDETRSLHWPTIGVFARASFSRRARNRDWALIELTDLQRRNNESLRSSTSFHQTPACPLGPLDVLVRNNSLYGGRLSGLPTRVILPFGDEFVRVDTLVLYDKTLQPTGWSGSWIVRIGDTADGNNPAYGILVAQDPFGELYVVPMMDILGDIKQEIDAVKLDLRWRFQASKADIILDSTSGFQRMVKNWRSSLGHMHHADGTADHTSLRPRVQTHEGQSNFITPVTPPRTPPASNQNVAKEWTTDQYTAAIVTYAEQRNTSLYPGVHFTHLARFLQGHVGENARFSPTYNHRSHEDFATLYECARHRPVMYRTVRVPSELRYNATSDTNNILFLRGQPSPEWLVQVGVSYHVDPEFFSRHLDFLSYMSGKNYYAQPSLPTARNMFQLSYTTIGQFPQSTFVNQRALDDLRVSAAEYMSAYYRDIGNKINRKMSDSESIVRAYHVLDKQHFAIEQRISVYVHFTGENWTVIVWLDTGKPLTPEQDGPWIQTLHENHQLGQETFLPTIQSPPFAALHAARTRIPHDRLPTRRMEQTASLLHLDYGKSLDLHSMLEDPFYALDEIFRFSAASHAQFLNLIDSKLQESATERNWSNLDVTHIHYLLRLLEEHAEHLRQTHSIITSRDGLGWPKPTDHNLRQKHALLATDLARDFEFLIHRSQVLTAMCNRQIQILLSAVALNESKNAIAQTEAMRKLALLAFIFLPLIFTSAFFSTNLGSFNDPQSSPGIWIWFVVSVPLVILVFFTMTWKENPMERVFAKFVLRKRKAAKGFGDLHGT